MPPKPVISLKVNNFSYSTLGSWVIAPFNSGKILDTGYDTSTHYLIQSDDRIKVLVAGYYKFEMLVQITNVPAFPIELIYQISIHDTNDAFIQGLLVKRDIVNYPVPGQNTATGVSGFLLNAGDIVFLRLRAHQVNDPLTESLTIKKAEFRIYAS